MSAFEAYDRVIQGNAVLPDRVLDNAYIAVRAGCIAAIGQGVPPPARTVDRYDDCLLFPGLVDAQVHAGSLEGVAGLADATRAAAAGGVTTIVDMPFDEPLPVDCLERFEAKVDAIGKLAIVDVALYVTPPKSGSFDWLGKLAEAGAAAIKISTYEYHPVRFPRTRTGDMIPLFHAAAEHGLPVGFHNEDEDIVKHFVSAAVAAGETGIEAHGRTRPPIAELVADAQILELASHTDVHCHIVHSSLAAGCSIAARYRSRGSKASVETCIHYLVLNEEDMLQRGAFLKINPPLRSEAEREALWGSVLRGEVDMISTDHVAWPESRKQDPDIFKNSSGAPGLEGLLRVLYTEAVDRRQLDPTLVARLTAENPARHFGLFPRKGQLAVGADADVAVLKLSRERFDPARLISKVKWSPYDGREMAAQVAATYLRGEKIFGAGRIEAEPGFGRFVPRGRTKA